MYRSARATPNLLKYSSFTGAKHGQHGRKLGLYPNGALLLNGPDVSQTLSYFFLKNGIVSFSRTPQLQRHSCSKYLVASKTAQFWDWSQRYFSRSCDEDIDKKSSTLASSEEGKDEVEESKKAEEAQVSCESDTMCKSGSKNSSSEALHAEEQEEQHQGTQEEAVEVEPSDKRKKKEGRKMNLLKMKFKKMLISCDKIHDSFENFPYYLNEHTKDLLVESAVAQLWHHKETKFGKSLRTSSHLILLTGSPGTEIYQEKLVRALAQHLKTSLLILDSDVLTTQCKVVQHCKQDTHDAHSESGGESGMSSPEGREIWTINTADDEDGDDEDGDDEELSRSKNAVPVVRSVVQTLGQIVKFQGRRKKPGVEVHISKSDEQDDDDSEEEETQSDALKVGDRVRFIGSKATEAAKKRFIFCGTSWKTMKETILSPRVGQQGVVALVSKRDPEMIGVKFETDSNKKSGASVKENTSSIYACDVKELEKVDAKSPERVPWMAPIEAFSELGSSPGGTIVYFPDLQKWMAKAVSRDERSFFSSHTCRSSGQF